MSYTYVETTIIKEKNGWYSLLVRCGNDKEYIYREITNDEEKICKLSKYINEGSLSALHIYDVIEDFLP